jgi:hypothetical protein
VFSTVQEEDQELSNQKGNGQNKLPSSPVSIDHGTTPKIAWLMSFPNSGTSYTINLVQAASNMSMASNYGDEHSGNETYSFPVQDGGPYWLDPEGIKPQDLVLTKTHCGGYCHSCRPRKSVETPHSFLMHCSRAEGTIQVNATTTTMVKHVYDYEHDVDRAVHLIRDPLDNMVSRYHLGVHRFEKEGNHAKLQRYTYDAQGFRNFCGDTTYSYAEHTDSHIDQDVLEMVQDVPCHLDLFRYVQWHNLAFITTHDLLNISTHMVHYHEYSNHFESTLAGLMNFLDMPNTGEVSEFEAGKSYRDYFSSEQIAAMRNATLRLASPKTWEHLERYF